MTTKRTIWRELFQRDKLWHFLMCICLMFFFDLKFSIGLSILFTSILAVGKEVYDDVFRGGLDRLDLWADFAGIFAYVLTIAIIGWVG